MACLYNGSRLGEIGWKSDDPDAVFDMLTNSHRSRFWREVSQPKYLHYPGPLSRQYNADALPSLSIATNSKEKRMPWSALRPLTEEEKRYAARAEADKSSKPATMY